MVDLNGDEVPEKLYAGEDGLYINGFCVLSTYGNASILFPDDLFWLLDIDTTDGYVEILLDRYFYTLAYYTLTGELITQSDVCGYYDSSDYENAVDIRKPVRIDEHTVAIVPEEYEIDFPHPIAYLNDEVPLTLYQQRDFSGDYFEVSGPQVYMFYKCDGTGWVYLDNYFGESGWIYAGENDEGVWCINLSPYIQGDFIGFSNVP